MVLSTETEANSESASAGFKGRVLVTGASGFLGLYLVDALVALGWEVIALVNRSDLSSGARANFVKTVRGNINDVSTMRDAISEADAVCHLAALIPTDYDDAAQAESCLRTNALATLELARLALEQGGRRFIYVSSGNGYTPGQTLATEESALFPADYATYYLGSKLVGELFVEHLRRIHELNSLILRVSSPYGWGMPARTVVARFMNDARESKPLQVWHGGLSVYDLVYVSDVAALIVAALKSGAPGIYNVGGGRAYSVLELAEAVVATFPEQSVKLEMKAAGDRAPAGFSALSIEKARETWGYTPRTLSEGLSEYRELIERGIDARSDTE